MACWMVEVEQSRIAKYSYQKASGHMSLLPTAIGAMPAVLSFVSSASSWLSVWGGVVMPAFWNRSFRYQKPTTWRS